MKIPFLLILFTLTLFTGCKSDDPPKRAEEKAEVTNPSLFKKYGRNPIIDIGKNVPVWRSIHAANVSIVKPSDQDGQWQMYLRGSGEDQDGYHNSIGMFIQSASGFNPYGPWQEYEDNPMITHGPAGSYDELHVLDAAACKGENGNIYLYYMARNITHAAAIAGSFSTDGGYSFTKFEANPLKMHVGPNDVVFHHQQFYVFYGDAQWNGNGFDDKLQIWVSVADQADQISTDARYALKVGSTEAFDSESVNGAKIFKVSGDSRWFMIYQSSNKYFDYPDRFHAAYSEDLLHWTKVDNDIPLMNRGNLGEWDQGGIWTGAVIEFEGSLYIYYEGWGSYYIDQKRNEPYYAGGNSRVGIASVGVKDFLNWVNQ